MPQQSHGTTQVRELRFSEKEIVDLITENAYQRLDHPYDFDYENPLVIRDGKDLIVRYVQKEITREASMRHIKMKPLEEPK